MNPPPMNIQVDQLLRTETLKNGPLVVFWNQEEWVEPNKELPFDPNAEGDTRKWWQKLLRYRLFRWDLRITPPPNMSLEDFGAKVAKAVGMDPATVKPEEGDRSMWMVGTVYATGAGPALGAFKTVFNEWFGENFYVGSIQAKVELV